MAFIRSLLLRLRNPSRQFPWTLGNEIAATKRVLQGSQWNMGYGTNLPHQILEKEFSRYTGNEEAVAVSSGGMALQIALRALGIVPGDEVVHQIDTCVANPFAVFNAGGMPIFADSDAKTFGLSLPSLESRLSSRTKAIIPIHLWGNPEPVKEIRQLAKDCLIIEDCCLALGATIDGKHVGTWGAAAVFSFGCVKPIQTGEGGMIVTNDKHLAREMRSIRSWGERGREFGDSDVTTLSWNGRMSEIIAAVALEQLRGYPKLLRELRENCTRFTEYLKDYPLIKPIHSPGSSYSQLVLRLDGGGFSKASLIETLLQEGVGAEPVNFEPANRYSFFKNEKWRPWIPQRLHERALKNYRARYPNADQIFDHTGIALARNNFLGRDAVPRLVQRWERAIDRAQSDSVMPLAITSK